MSDIAKRIAEKWYRGYSGCTRNELEQTVDAELAPLLAVVEAAERWQVTRDKKHLQEFSVTGAALWDAVDAYRAAAKPATCAGCEKCSFHGIYRHEHPGGYCWALCPCIIDRLAKLEGKA